MQLEEEKKEEIQEKNRLKEEIMKNFKKNNFS